jgi:hypothetical protein
MVYITCTDARAPFRVRADYVFAHSRKCTILYVLTHTNTCAALNDLLAQPGAPATPIDAMFYAPGSPHVVSHGEIWAAPSELPRNSSHAASGLASATTTTLWYTVLAVDVTTPYMLATVQLWPAPDTMAQFVVTSLSQPCADGANASACATLLNAETPLHVSTAPPHGVELGHQLYHLAPVLPSGWVVVGELTRFVAASPKRIVSVKDDPKGPTVSVMGEVGEQIVVQFVRPLKPLRQKGAFEGTVVNVVATVGGDGKGTARPPQQA